MEAFDQPWKAAAEGEVGAYWGVYDADRQPKFAFRAADRAHAAVARAGGRVGAALRRSCCWLFYFHSDTLRNRGRSFLAVVVYATATAAGLDRSTTISQQYLTVTQRAGRRRC